MNLALSTSHRFTHTTRSKSLRLLISGSRGQHSAIRICIRWKQRSPSHPAITASLQSVNSFLIKVKAFQSKALQHWRGSTLYGTLKGKIKWVCSLLTGSPRGCLKTHQLSKLIQTCWLTSEAVRFFFSIDGRNISGLLFLDPADVVKGSNSPCLVKLIQIRFWLTTSQPMLVCFCKEKSICMLFNTLKQRARRAQYPTVSCCISLQETKQALCLYRNLSWLFWKMISKYKVCMISNSIKHPFKTSICVLQHRSWWIFGSAEWCMLH